MKKVCLLAALIFIAKLTIFAEEYELQYSPFGEIMYFSGIWGENETISTESPQLYRTEKINSKEEFEYAAYRVDPNSSSQSDLCSHGPIPITNKGKNYFWRYEWKYMPVEGEFTTGLPPMSGRSIAELPTLFPYFTKPKYAVGEQWDVFLPLPITFSTEWYNYDAEKIKTIYCFKVKVIQKFERVTNLLGYKCALINYTITDSLKSPNGEMMRFLCDGTTYFAINEGFIVSEMMEVSYDMLNSKSVVEHRKIKRKLRMLDYKPYSEKK